MPYLKRINSLPLINHISYKYAQVSDIGPSWSSCFFLCSMGYSFHREKCDDPFILMRKCVCYNSSSRYLNVYRMAKLSLVQIESICKRPKKRWFPAFSPFPTMFQKPSFQEVLKVWIVC